MKKTTNNNTNSEAVQNDKIIEDTNRNEQRVSNRRSRYNGARPTEKDCLGGVKRNYRGKSYGGLTRNNNLHSEILKISAVSRTNAGGRIRRLSAISVIGDKNGSIGLGKGKNERLSQAIRTSSTRAKKSIKKINLHNLQLTHTTEKKFGATKVKLMPRQSGGLRCSATITKMLTALGVKHAASKITGRSHSVANAASATMKCLEQQETNADYAKKCGISYKKLHQRICANLFRPKRGVR